jgi:hypothetical protein
VSIPGNGHGIVIDDCAKPRCGTIHEISGIERSLKAKEIIAEKSGKDFLAMGGAVIPFPFGPGYVPEMSDDPLLIGRADHPGNPAEVIIMDPDRRIPSAFFKNRLGKRPVGLFILLPERG